jgi:predicted DNA-binding transcriptional regulator AlpA
MIQDRTCRECGCSFEGGPRAYYCQTCREERRRRQNTEGKAKARKGLTRKLGSIDTCQRCKNEYTVNSGLQRFCPDCQPQHTLEYDRETSLPFYHEHKERINPVRNERRRVGERNCDWCGNPYNQVNSQLTCSDECKRQLKNKKWNEKYGPAYEMRKAIPPLVGHKEAAEILGWSKQQLSVYLKRGKFPQPIQTLASGPIWTRAQIEQYKQSKAP